MADIDFDELDKAVNDLMANVDTSKRTAGLDEPEEKIVSIPASSPTPAVVAPAPAPTTTPSTEAPAQPVEPAAAVTTTPAGPSLAMKRRGQFMDIVHPSRDMNTPKLASRQGVTIQPGNDVVAASAAQQNEPAPMPNATPAQPSVETPESTPSAWPDPIDMANTPAVAPEASSASTLTPELPSEAAGEAPLTSPFLPDAKPEKRPLGSPMPAEDASSSATEAPVDDTQTPATPEPTPAVVLPEEFSGDLMAVESRDLSSHSEQPVTLPAPAEQPKLEAGEEEALIPAVASPDPIEQPQAPAQPQTQPPAGGSIAQQYTEQPSSGDQSNGSIYDTSAYHQPIEPVVQAKKKTPTSVWIMVGVGLLLLGAIGGAAYFYFTR